MSDWKNFLDQQIPTDLLKGDCLLNDLSDLGLIRVSGEDKRSLLQGQLTNDIEKVSTTRSQLSSVCSPKGRMKASFRIFQRNDDLYLQLPSELLPDILKRLRMFVMMSKVVLDDLSEELHCIGLSGTCAAAILADTLPENDNDAVTVDQLTIIRIPGEVPRYQVIGNSDALQVLWQKAGEQARFTGRAYWSLQDIRAGIPSVYAQTIEAFVPQMVNMHVIDGVSFTKGCYTGQEIVARMQYLGKLKRRMYRVKIATDTEPQPGSELFSASSRSGQGAGKIVTASRSPDGGFEALAVIQISSVEEGDIKLGDVEGAVLELLELPYTVETAT